MKRRSALTALLAAVATGPVLAQTEITNPSFEYEWSGWTDADPNKDATSISGHSNTGAKSAKITGETGRFEQEVTLYPDSEYIMRAVVKGPGQVGITVGEEVLSAASEGDGENWIPLEIAFATGADTSSGILFGAHNGEEGRFDDFELEAVSGPALAAAEEAAKGPKVYATIPGGCENMSQLRIKSASDDGTNDGHTPEMTIDGDFTPESRWSSENTGKEIIFDMGMPQSLKEVGLAFYKGDERQTFVSVETSINGNDYSSLVERIQSSGTSLAIERFDFDDRPVRFIKVIGQGNSSNEWNSIVEFQAYGCGLGEMDSQGDGTEVSEASRKGMFDLFTDVPPAENIDLTAWKITLPVDQDGDGRADEIEERMLSAGWADEAFFYTDPATGGMVFRTFGGNATTQNSNYARSELREMIRAGDTSISTRNDDGTPTKNNWVFSSAPAEAQEAAGGVDGALNATLAVNQVTRLGEGSKIGRVIIGQIHAKDGEPIRLYYRKLPTNKYGSVYYIHELEGRDDIYVPIVGDRSDFAENPDDGIALDEVFSYEISVTGEEIEGKTHPMLNVSITRDDGTVIQAEPLDMVDSSYDIANEFMYFKAGAYSQNDSSPWPDRDYDQVTFFELEATH